MRLLLSQKSLKSLDRKLKRPFAYDKVRAKAGATAIECWTDQYVFETEERFQEVVSQPGTMTCDENQRARIAKELSDITGVSLVELGPWVTRKRRDIGFNARTVEWLVHHNYVGAVEYAIEHMEKKNGTPAHFGNSRYR